MVLARSVEVRYKVVTGVDEDCLSATHGGHNDGDFQMLGEAFSRRAESITVAQASEGHDL